MKTPNVICLTCAKPFHVNDYRLKTALYCSKSCSSKRGKIQIEKNCKICGKAFEAIPFRAKKAKYCSRECYHKGQVGKGMVKSICQHCKCEFESSFYRARKFCSQACVNKSNIETYVPHFTTIRKHLWKTGQMESCEKCGYHKVKEILGIHHIDENRENNSRDNLMVLCPNCHSLAHMKHIPHHHG